MACEGYSNKALMGNWYEDRVGVPQPYRENLEHRQKREVEEDIAFVGRNNQLMALKRIERVHPWNTSAVICDDGFRDYKTVNRTSYDPVLLRNYKGYNDCRPVVKTNEPKKVYPENQTLIQTHHAKKYSLVTDENMKKHVNDTEREVKMNITDFRSTFKSHPPDHERFHKLTSYQQFYDRPLPTRPGSVIENDGKRLTSFYGGNLRPESAKGIRMTSALTAEVLKTEKDPQQNTRVQRSWLPYVENAVEAAENNIQKNATLNSANGLKTTTKMDNYRANNSQLLPYDIATSLPMADGIHSLKSKHMQPGAFRKIRTDVTIIKNKPLTKK